MLISGFKTGQDVPAGLALLKKAARLRSEGARQLLARIGEDGKGEALAPDAAQFQRATLQDR
jgi:hypothetical protein